MTETISSNNFLSTDSQEVNLIEIPSKFTSIEANFLEKIFQQFHQSYKPIETDLADSKVKKVIIDFGETTFMDNGGLVGLCKIFRIAKERKINLSFLRFSPQVKIILSLAGLEEFFLVENNHTWEHNKLTYACS